MKLRVRFTPRARSHFRSALASIRQARPSAAIRFRKHAEDVLRRLETFPDSGRQIPEFPNHPYREVIVPPYRFFYRVEGRTVWVIAVWHDARLLREELD